MQFTPEDEDRQRKASRARRRIGYPGQFNPAFWDDLDVVQVTRGSLEELDRRNRLARRRGRANHHFALRAQPSLVEDYNNVTRGMDLRRFAMRGGPDMSAHMALERARVRSSSPPPNARPEPVHPRFLEHDAHFSQHLRDHAILPPQANIPDDQQHIPAGIGRLRRRVRGPRVRPDIDESLDPFPAYDWEHNRIITFQDSLDRRRLDSDGETVHDLSREEAQRRFFGRFLPILAYPNATVMNYEELTQYRDVQPVTGSFVEPPFPDLVDGGLREELHPLALLDERLMSLISVDNRADRDLGADPSGRDDPSDLILPNFILDEGRDTMHTRYAAAYGARAMHAIDCLTRKLQRERIRRENVGGETTFVRTVVPRLSQQDLDDPWPVRDTICFSAHFWRATLTLSAHHMEDVHAGTRPLKPVFTTKIAEYDMTDVDEPDDFRAGLAAFANLRDIAREQRVTAMERLNQAYEDLGYGSSPVESD